MKRAMMAGLPLLFLIFISACTSTSPTPEVEKNKVIIFVPGLFGSALADAKTGERVFQTFRQAVWGKIPLALNGDALGIAGAVELKAEALLENISVVPYLYSVDGYGESVNYLRRQFGKRAEVISFFYDWRQNDVLAVQALGRQVRQLRAAGATSIALVGHSLGAAVIAFYLRYGEQDLGNAEENWEGAKLVDAAVLAGVPYRGALNAFRDLLKGTTAGLSDVPLSAVSLGSFPSYYQFLPPRDSAAFVTRSGVSFGKAVYEVENWKQWKVGLFQNLKGVDPESRENREKYTRQYLADANRFSSLTRAPPSSTSASRRIPLLTISGIGFATPAKAIWDGTQWIFAGESLSEDGDNLVTAESAALPEAFSKSLAVERISMKMEHRGMYTRRDLQEKVTTFLTAQGF